MVYASTQKLKQVLKLILQEQQLMALLLLAELQYPHCNVGVYNRNMTHILHLCIHGRNTAARNNKRPFRVHVSSCEITMT